MTCVRCGYEITGGLYLPHSLYCKHHRNGMVATYMGPAHLGCPTPRERQAIDRRARAVGALVKP